MWIGAQIIIAEQALHNDTHYRKNLKKILSDAKSIVDLNGLIIIGLNDLKNYEIVGEICDRLDIESYLYHPVLADIPGYSPTQEVTVVNYDGQRGYGDISLWKRWWSGTPQLEVDNEDGKLLSEMIFPNSPITRKDLI